MKETTWCLNNEVIFIPARRVLSRRDGRAEPVILNEPTAKILEILLTCNGITPQKKLYESAWKNNGAKTTPNNLYQNISLLRRSLNNVFLRRDEYIITAPRKGFYISPEVNIAMINDECALPPAESRHPPVNTDDRPGHWFLAWTSRLRATLTGSGTKHHLHPGYLLLIILSILIFIVYHVSTSENQASPSQKVTDSFCDGK